MLVPVAAAATIVGLALSAYLLFAGRPGPGESARPAADSTLAAIGSTGGLDSGPDPSASGLPAVVRESEQTAGSSWPEPSRPPGSAAIRETVPGTPDAGKRPQESSREPGLLLAGRLRITVLPWAEVLIDGRSLGVTPLSAPVEVAPGPHRIVLKHPAFPQVARVIDVRDSLQDLRFDLNREFALVDIRVSPWAVLEVDDRMIDTTPLAKPIPLTLGEHVVTLSHPELGVRTERIRTDSVRSYRFVFDLARK
jgi:hypothetical protein